MKLVLIATVLLVLVSSYVYFVPPIYRFFVKYTAHKYIWPPAPITISTGENVTVTLSLGQVKGSNVKPNFYDSHSKHAQVVHQFLGVPFAKPPIGKLRFKKSQPISKWSPKVVDATMWPPSCLQTDRLAKLFNYQSLEFSEDCLYLNIWTPSLPTSSSQLKPVFVWIYGGGFSVGSSNQAMYHGAALASSQDILVVNFNYRLGPHGFLVSPDGVSEENQAPGNAAFWDQITALEFVQDHIKYFGGDPTRVTVAGESAGSISVSALSHSPVVSHAKLFNSIVTMSGSSVISTSFHKKERELTKTQILSKLVSCPTGDNESMMKCLMEIEGSKLVITDMNLLKQFPGQESFTSGIMIFSPIHGDELLPQRPVDLIKREDAKNGKLRVLTGAVDFEGGVMRLGKRDETSKLHKLKSNNDRKLWISETAQYLRDDHKMSALEAEAIATFYFKDAKTAQEKEKSFFDLIGDLHLVCPSYLENEMILSNTQSIHQYLFTYKSKSNEIINLICPDDGVCHGMELGYFFGSSLLQSNAYFKDERDMKQAWQTMNLLGSFVRGEEFQVTRNSTNKSWPAFDSDKLSLEINYLKDHPVIKDFRGEQCRLLKNHILKERK